MEIALRSRATRSTDAWNNFYAAIHAKRCGRRMRRPMKIVHCFWPGIPFSLQHSHKYPFGPRRLFVLAAERTRLLVSRKREQINKNNLQKCTSFCAVCSPAPSRIRFSKNSQKPNGKNPAKTETKSICWLISFFFVFFSSWFRLIFSLFAFHCLRRIWFNGKINKFSNYSAKAKPSRGCTNRNGARRWAQTNRCETRGNRCTENAAIIRLYYILMNRRKTGLRKIYRKF